MTLSPVQIADTLLGASTLPKDPTDPKRAAAIGPATVRELIIQAINTDRGQDAPDPKALTAFIISQYPATSVFSRESVARLVTTALTAFQAQGARLGQSGT